jgi:hypothetical protein
VCAVFLIAGFAGCGGGNDTPDGVVNTDNGVDSIGSDVDVVDGMAVETIVSANAVAVGQEVTVECRISGEGSAEATAGFTVSGGDTFTKDGMKVVFTAPGSYQVACTVEGTDVVDETPEAITVADGSVAKVVTTLADEEIVAGTTTTVTCTAFDAFGNTLSIALVIVIPSDLSIAGNSVTGTKAGIYAVACQPADGIEGVTIEDADLKVVSGPASGLELSLIPAKANYRVNNQVKVGFTLVDQYGNPVDGGAITTPTVTPTEGISPLDADPYSFKFGVEGVFTFSACVVDDPETCDTIDAYCDGTAPLLAIEYPERAAMLSGDKTVMVTGTVSDAVGGLAELTINGNVVSVTDEGTFEYPMPVVQGLNIIDANATDVFGLKMRSMRSYLFSDVYYPAVPEDPKISLITNAVQAYLDDKLLDNPNDPTDMATVAAIAEEVVANMDIMALLPNPLVVQRVWPCDYEVKIKSLTFDRPDVASGFYEGGIAIDVVIPNFAGQINVDDPNNEWYEPCVNEDGEMSAKELIVKVGINISVDPVTKQLRVSSKGTSVDFVELDISIGWTVDWLLGLLNSTITDLLKGVVNDQIDTVINDLEATVNEAIADPIDIALKGFIPGMADMVLSVTVQPEAATFVTEGGQLDVSLAVTAPKHIDRAIIPGSIGRADCLTGVPEDYTFDTANPYKINAAIYDDLISQAAFALWYTGGTNIDLTAEAAAEMGLDLAQYGFADLTAMVRALLPPIVATCGRENLVIQLGDAYLELNTSNFFGRPLDMHAFLFAELEAELTMGLDEDGAVALNIQILPPNRLDLNIVEINQEWWGEEETLIGMITGIIPALITDPFQVAIPTFNLKDLGGDSITLPDMDLVIDIQQIEQIVGHTVVGANLQIQTPAPIPTP